MFFWYFIRGRFVNSVIGEFCINLNAEVDGVFFDRKKILSNCIYSSIIIIHQRLSLNV